MLYGIGQSVLRSEDPRFLTGRGRYADDFNMPHQVYAAMLRSPHASARISRIISEHVLALPDVVAVLTGEDYWRDGLGEIVGGAPGIRRDGSPMFRPPRPALSRDQVRHTGEIVAIVIAESAALAKDAAEQLEVDYEVLPAHMGTASANQPGAAAVWEQCPDNESFYYQVGDEAKTDAALANAPHRIAHHFVINRVGANPMEPRGALGSYEAGDDRYTIVTGSQRPYAWRTALSKHLFHIHEHQLTLVTGDVGGSFGIKGGIYPEIPLMAWASRRVGRPVKWTSERSEGFLADDHARDNVTDAEIGFDDDGNVLALKVRTNANLGAYLTFNGFGPPTGNVGTLAGPYTIPAMHVGVSGVFTHTTPLSPYRGAGRPEAAYVLESMIDAAATALAMNPAQLRQRNLIPPESMPYRTALVYTYDCGEFDALMSKCIALANYGGRAARRGAARERGKLHGVGLTMSIEIAARLQPETAELRFDPSGSATLLVGTTSHGQGHETIYKQVLFDQLGLHPDRIRVVEGDTDKVSFGTGTGGSRVSALGSAAVVRAAEKVIEKGRVIAAHLLETAEADLVFTNGRFEVEGTDRAVSLDDVIDAAFKPSALPANLEPGLYELATFNPEKSNFPNACHVCEVEIDPETGVVEIVRYSVVDDVGTELNPLLIKGQVHGGIVQGAGQALMENMVIDPDSGQLITGSFMDYCMPRADDFCFFDVGSHPVPTATNPLGAKGVGESGTVGALPAVMIAVNDALASIAADGVEMPATPEKVWRAIRAAG